MFKHVIPVFLLIGLSYSQGGGYALDFDGTNDYVNIGNVGNYSSDLTVMSWIKKDSQNSWDDIISGVGGDILFAVFQNKLVLGCQGASPFNHDTYSTTSLNDNIWHHVAATYDANGGANNLKIYIDGALENQATKTGTFTAGNLTIGSNASNTENFNGLIDEISVWGDVRTAAEIQEYMHKEVASDASGLVAYYKMSNGSGTSLADNSSNSNTGTLNNMDNNDWVTSYAPIGDLNSSYETDVEAIWKVSGTSASDASDGLTMTVSSALSTGNFAVYGNNNTSGTSTSDIGSVGSTIRTGRIWQVDESGTVAGTVTIDISDATGNAGESGTASNFRLLYRSGTSGDFSSAATGASISGDAVSFTSVSLADGYYALGAESDASLPVELTSFNVLSTRSDAIILQWVTESEINNLGFILDRRVPGTEWTEIATYSTHPELQGQGSVTHQTIYSYTDNTVLSAETYDYRLADVDYDGNKVYHSMTVMGVSPNDVVPETFTLYPAYPNPFNPVTTIRYDLPEDALVNITIYDMVGRIVSNLVSSQQTAGYKSTQWNATNNAGQPVSAGLYLYTIQAGEFRQVRKMVLLK